MAILSQIGPDDFVMVCLHYLPSLIGAIFVCFTISSIFIFFAFKRPHKKAAVLAISVLAILPLLLWMAYVISSRNLTTTLVLLDSEDAQTAERTYNKGFKTEVNTLENAVELAIDSHNPPNVRFYASCLIADMLSANTNLDQGVLFNKVGGAPIIETQFIGGNSLTDEFVTPGHQQARLSVRELIERRLLYLKNTN
ncbi:MAG: hypothetical protein JF609_09650 [Verrucomicrobia bacterium]|nr:hypothetical protein [Verrucomicrobiota bacterium]